MDEATTQDNTRLSPTRHSFAANIICDGDGLVQLADESAPYACPLCAAHKATEQPLRGTVSGRFTSTHPHVTSVMR
jgi:hypothetical protein